MNVEALGLEPSEAVGDGLESFPYGVEMVESFLQAEVAQVIGAKLVAEEAGELLVLFEEGVLPVGAEDVMAMLDLIDDRGQFPMQSFVQAHAEDLADPIRRQTPEADFTASFEDLVNREVTLENEIPAVLDLGDGVEAGQADLLALLLGKLWPQDQGPVIELFANDGRTQPIGRCLQRRHIVHGKEGVVVLAETDFGALQFLFHEGVAVEPVRCMEREKTGYLSGLSRPEQVVYFFHDVLGLPVVDKEVLRQRTNDYQNWVQAYACNHNIPIQWAEKGVRKEDYVLPALHRMEKTNAY